MGDVWGGECGEWGGGEGRLSESGEVHITYNISPSIGGSAMV